MASEKQHSTQPPLDAVSEPYDYYALVPHPSEPHLLFLPDGSQWALPHWQDAERHYWQTTLHVNTALHQRFGIEATVLRCLATDRNPATGRIARLYEMETHGMPHVVPRGARWCGRDALDALACPEQRPLLVSWFDEAEAGVPQRRRPWARRGWMKPALTWIDEQLASLGMIRSGHGEQLRSWERSCLLRAPTTAGHIYFKAVPPMFAHEPPLTQALATWYPGATPRVLALDAARGWLLLADFGGHTLDADRDIMHWEQALSHFATLQIDLSRRVDELRALGCPERFSTLADAIPALLEDDAAIGAGHAWSLTPEQVSTLRLRTGEFQAVYAALAAYRVPLSLEHGDFWANNVAVMPGAYLYFDWSDASISHPFFSLASFLRDLVSLFPDVANLHVRLTNAYLEPWTRFAPMKEVQSAFALARLLAPLHFAITYQRDILPSMEARWEMERMIPYHLATLT